MSETFHPVKHRRRGKEFKEFCLASFLWQGETPFCCHYSPNQTRRKCYPLIKQVYLYIFMSNKLNYGVFFDLRKSAILNFWPTPNKIACPSLGGRGLSFSPKFRNFVSYNGQPLSNLPPPYFIYMSPYSFIKTPILKGWPKCLQLNKKFPYFLTGFV